MTTTSNRPRERRLRDDLLAGRTAWITGRGASLGLAMARRSGARVGVAGRRDEPPARTGEQ